MTMKNLSFWKNNSKKHVNVTVSVFVYKAVTLQRLTHVSLPKQTIKERPELSRKVFI